MKTKNLFLLVAILMLVPFSAYSYPVQKSERIINSITSVYQDGFQVNSTGTAYTHYFQKQSDGTWGSVKDLTLGLTTLKPLLASGVVKLTGYNANTDSWDDYTGNGDDLTAHNTNFGWNSKYTIGFDGNDVEIDIQLCFDFSLTSLGLEQQGTYKSVWETNMEDWWNDRYLILKDDGLFSFPIVFDVTFDGYPSGDKTFWDQIVTVRNGSGRADMTNWFLADTDQTNAHEFGHMFGLYDEYWAGALDPATKLPDYDNLMGANIGTLNMGEGLKPSYFAQFVEWIDSIDPDPLQSYKLRAVPEPTSFILLISGLLIFFLSYILNRFDICEKLKNKEKRFRHKRKNQKYLIIKTVQFILI